MDDQPMQHENRVWMQVQQPIFANFDQFRGQGECSRIVGFELMAWPTQPNVPRWTRLTDGNWLHPKTPEKDGLLQAFSFGDRPKVHTLSITRRNDNP